MDKIVNRPNPEDDHIESLRKATEHRASWLYLLLDEARQTGLDWEAIGRRAVYRCGLYNFGRGKESIDGADDFIRFRETVFAYPGSSGQRQMNIDYGTMDDETAHYRYHYCPLVTGWQNMGASDKDIEILCDMAMDGDRAINELFETFAFRLGPTLAQGRDHCDIYLERVTPKSKDLGGHDEQD